MFRVRDGAWPAALQEREFEEDKLEVEVFERFETVDIHVTELGTKTHA